MYIHKKSDNSGNIEVLPFDDGMIRQIAMMNGNLSALEVKKFLLEGETVGTNFSTYSLVKDLDISLTEHSVMTFLNTLTMRVVVVSYHLLTGNRKAAHETMSDVVTRANSLLGFLKEMNDKENRNGG